MPENKSNPEGFPPSRPITLADLVDYSENSIVSRTLRKSKIGTMTIFAFDKGQELSEHSDPFDAFVQVLDGRAELVIGGRSIIVTAGQTVLMPADIPHAVKAPDRFKMQLLMFKG